MWSAVPLAQGHRQWDWQGVPFLQSKPCAVLKLPKGSELGKSLLWDRGLQCSVGWQWCVLSSSVLSSFSWGSVPGAHASTAVGAEHSG